MIAEIGGYSGLLLGVSLMDTLPLLQVTLLSFSKLNNSLQGAGSFIQTAFTKGADSLSVNKSYRW